jgi:hypothetical protein
VYLVVGWEVIEVAMVVGPGSLEAYRELMSVIGNVLRTCRPVEGLAVLDSRPAAKTPVVALRAQATAAMLGSEDLKI